MHEKVGGFGKSFIQLGRFFLIDLLMIEFYYK